MGRPACKTDVGVACFAGSYGPGKASSDECRQKILAHFEIHDDDDPSLLGISMKISNFWDPGFNLCYLQ